MEETTKEHHTVVLKSLLDWIATLMKNSILTEYADTQIELQRFFLLP